MMQLFAVTAPGLAALAVEELRALGLASIKAEAGGVSFSGDLPALYRANLHLRTVSRVLVRLGDFYATSFPQLRSRARALPWEAYLQPGQPVALHVTCHKSKLYHSGAVAERVLAALSDRLGRPSPPVKPAGEEEDSASPAQLVIVRFDRDHCTISVDSSGALLHRRGYRQAVAKAPLRETIAAAMLLASGWDRTAPLLDPFCGSGTIPIEAALLALGRPPGCDRAFAFSQWPGFSAAAWEAIRSACVPVERPTMPLLFASDRDAGAIRMAQANAERAGVAGWIEFSTKAVSAITPPAQPGWIVTNPPYGVRVSGTKDLRNLYAQFGNVLRSACPGWRVAVLSSDLQLLGQIGLPLDTALMTVNGGLSVRMVNGSVPQEGENRR